MKLLPLLFLAMLFSGCTTYSITNPSLLLPVQPLEQLTDKNLVTLPLNVEASMHCYQSNKKIRCSNKGRLELIEKQFEDRGFHPVLSKNPEDPKISLIETSESALLGLSTNILNLLTLGIVPEFRYKDYTVNFTDPKKNINVTQTVRVSTAKSWFHLFMSNPENLEGSWRKRAEENLMSSVLDKAKIGKNESK